MSSVLAAFATHWFHPAAAPQAVRPPRTPVAIRRRSGQISGHVSPGAAILAVLGHAYRAAQRAQMRRIRMQLSLHGLTLEHGGDTADKQGR